MVEPFLWRVDYDTQRGRLLRATRYLKTGESVLWERAYGSVVLSRNHAALCTCLCAADAALCCDDCSTVFFCSDECQLLFERIHKIECKALETVDVTACQTKTNADLLRLLIRILAVHSLEKKDDQLLRPTDDHDRGMMIHATYTIVIELVHVMEKENSQWTDNVRAGASKIMEDLPDEKCKFSVAVTAIASVVATARAKLASAKQHLDRFRYADVVAELAESWRRIDVNGQRIPFHPSHGVVIAMTRVLSDAQIKLGNAVEAYKIRQRRLKALELVSWRYHLPLALAHFDYAEALRRMLVHPTSLVPENVHRDELQQEMRASCQAFNDICVVCLGKPHPLRRRAVASLKF